VNDDITPAGTTAAAGGGIALRNNQTIMVVWNDGSGSNKAIVSAVDTAAGTFQANYYEAGGSAGATTGAVNSDVTIFIYGSEFNKGLPEWRAL
jgi:type 1 fimbria pilin